jgi:hypothetical protein
MLAEFIEIPQIIVRNRTVSISNGQGRNCGHRRYWMDVRGSGPAFNPGLAATRSMNMAGPVNSIWKSWV